MHAARRVRSRLAGPGPAGHGSLGRLPQRRRDGGPAGHVQPVDRGKAGDHLGADPGHRVPGRRGQHVRHQRRDLLQAPVEHHVIARGRPGGTARHHVTDPCAYTARPGCARAGHDRSDQRRPLGQGRDQAGGRGPGDAAGEPESGPDRGVVEVDPVPVAAGDQPRRAARHGEQDAGRLLRPRSDPGEHGRAEQPAGGGDLVAHRPARPDAPLRIRPHRPGEGGRGGPRRLRERPVVDEHRVGEHRRRSQRGEHEPARDGVRDGHQPVRVVRDDVQRARRRADHQVLQSATPDGGRRPPTPVPRRGRAHPGRPRPRRPGAVRGPARAAAPDHPAPGRPPTGADRSRRRRPGRGWPGWEEPRPAR